MNDRDLMFLPAHRQRRMIIDKDISSIEMAEASLRRIAELEPRLNAFITLDEAGALSSAKNADERLAAGDEPGVLYGVPIAVKDLEVTKGLRTTLGSSFFEDWVPDYDSVVVERLRATGAVILGKTNTPEFGNREETFSNVAPTCNNPWDPSRMPETFETPDLLAEEGIEYVGDWALDDQPCELKTTAGTLYTIPYTVELNDIPMMMIQHHRASELFDRAMDQFERLYAEGVDNARIMAIAVHPYITGVPHRIKYYEKIFETLAGKPGVLFWTGEQILDWYKGATGRQQA